MTTPSSSRCLGINLNRSDFGIELGYFLSFLTPSLGIRFLGTGFYTHGGVALSRPVRPAPAGLSSSSITTKSENRARSTWAGASLTS